MSHFYWFEAEERGYCDAHRPQQPCSASWCKWPKPHSITVHLNTASHDVQCSVCGAKP